MNIFTHLQDAEFDDVAGEEFTETPILGSFINLDLSSTEEVIGYQYAIPKVSFISFLYLLVIFFVLFWYTIRYIEIHNKRAVNTYLLRWPRDPKCVLARFGTRLHHFFGPAQSLNYWLEDHTGLRPRGRSNITCGDQLLSSSLGFFTFRSSPILS